MRACVLLAVGLVLSMCSVDAGQTGPKMASPRKGWERRLVVGAKHTITVVVNGAGMSGKAFIGGIDGKKADDPEPYIMTARMRGWDVMCFFKSNDEFQKYLPGRIATITGTFKESMPSGIGGKVYVFHSCAFQAAKKP